MRVNMIVCLNRVRVCLENLLAKLPHSPVEPSLLRLESASASASELDADIDTEAEALPSTIHIARVVIAPRGVHAADVIVRGLPLFVYPGYVLQFELALSDTDPCTAPAELEAAAASLALHARVDIALVGGETLQPLQAVFERRSGLREGGGRGKGSVGVAVTVAIPEGANSDATVVVRGVSVVGQAVMLGQELPVRLRCILGMQAPLRLKKTQTRGFVTPVIARGGTLYAPQFGEVAVFSADGSPLPPLPLAALGLSSNTVSATFNEATGTLLLTDCNEPQSKLVAVDAASRTVRWSVALEDGCFGIAVLPAQDLIVASAWESGQLRVHRLVDGARVANVTVYMPTYAAADPEAAVVYVSTKSNSSIMHSVSAFRWDGDGSALVAEGAVEAAGNECDRRPLAIVPPAPGQRTSYLVVGTLYSPTLRVLSLPDRRLVHTHELEGINVHGLAADPSGTALAVSDLTSQAIFVLPWPLPGMEVT